MARFSTRVRLVAAALIVAVLVLGLGAAVSRPLVAGRADAQAQRFAQQKLADLTGMAGAVSYRPSAVNDALGGSITWAIDFGNGRLVVVGLWAPYLKAGQSLPAADPARPDQQLLAFTLAPVTSCVKLECDLAGRMLRAVEQNVSIGGVPARAYVLVAPFAAAEALSTVDPILMVGFPVGLLLVGLLTWWVVGRVLRWVERIRTDVVHITSTDLSRRVAVPPTGDELQRWAVTTNETLDRLEAAMTRYRSFVDDAAHELRSPLAGLISTLEVASAHPDRADLPAAVTAALADARRLQRLTDDLLLLARLDQGAPVRRRVVDLDALVAEQVAERRFAGHGPRYLVSTVDAQLLGDEGQLERVLRNLLDNAARFARSEVRVDLTRDADWIAVDVLDDGPGIPAEHRARVFDRFARLDPARDQDHGGSGLGLAIARDIVHGHGGRIEIAESTAGARFVVRLPAQGSGGQSGIAGIAGIADDVTATMPPRRRPSPVPPLR
jgi:signal transduction histidine kinase